MSSKERYCYRILRSYSLLVDFNGQPPKENVPGPVDDDETFGQWARRVLGSGINGVTVYAPVKPRNQTRLRSLQKSANAEHLLHVIRAFGREKERQRRSAVDAAKDETKRALTSVSKHTLEDLHKEFGDRLEPAVGEFLNRFLKKADAEIEVEEIIRALLKAYNEAVMTGRGGSSA